MKKMSRKGRADFPENVDREWFHTAFSDDYLRLYAHRNDEEAERQVESAVKLVPFQAGQAVLDIACGSGRHMRAFARKGARVTGIDLSPVLVKAARGRSSKEGLHVVVCCGDMRDMAYREEFDGTTVWFTSLGYFAAVSEDRKAIRRLAAALKPGGWWWIDLANPGYVEANIIPHSRRMIDGVEGRAEVTEERRLVGRRVEKRIHIVDGLGPRTYLESVRLYRPEEFGPLIKAAGLKTDGVLGDYDGRALTKDAPRQIWYGHKPRGR